MSNCDTLWQNHGTTQVLASHTVGDMYDSDIPHLLIHYSPEQAPLKPSLYHCYDDDTLVVIWMLLFHILMASPGVYNSL